MKLKAWKTVGLVMALIGAASIAEAQRPGGGRGNREEMIKKYDKDGDGKLSENERAAMREDMKNRRGDKGKPNGDKGPDKGGAGYGERPTPEQIVKKYDKDGSGELSASELEQLFKDQMERMRQRGGMEGRRPGNDEGFQGRGGRGGPEGGGERPSREEMMKKYDTDGDGQLSEDERAKLREDMQNRRGNR